MKTLLIFRHAKSDWNDPSLPDKERPLNPRGKQDAPKMGRLLRKQGLLPDIVLCSNAKRARRTLELASDAAAYRGETLYLDSLYAAPPQAYLKALAKLGERHDLVMVVGHNPGLEELLALLTGETQALPTAAIAQVELPIKSWEELGKGEPGRLVELWKPKGL